MSSFTIVPIIALICYIFLLVSFLAAKKDAAILLWKMEDIFVC